VDKEQRRFVRLILRRAGDGFKFHGFILLQVFSSPL